MTASAAALQQRDAAAAQKQTELETELKSTRTAFTALKAQSEKYVKVLFNNCTGLIVDVFQCCLLLYCEPP